MDAKKEATRMGFGKEGIEKGSPAANLQSGTAKSGDGGVAKGGVVSHGQKTGAKQGGN